MDNQNSEVTPRSLKSFERIQEYPIIKDSFTKASEYYNWIKEKNSKLNSTLTWTENNVKSVIGVIEPIAGQRLGTVDNFACNQLDKIENKYPIIKESSENILKASSEYYDSSIKPTVDKVVAAKNTAVDIAKTPFRIASQSIEILSSTTNSFVNRYMSSGNNSGTSTVEKKEYDILFGRALREIDTLRYYSKKSLEGLSNVLSSIYDQSITKNRDLINKYYQQYVDEVEKKNCEHQTSELSLMEIVKSLSNKLRVSVRAISTVCYNHMNENNKEKLDKLFGKTEQIYSNINKTTYNDIREQISLENVHRVGEMTRELLENVKDVLITKYKGETGQSPAEEFNTVYEDRELEELLINIFPADCSIHESADVATDH